MEVVTTTTSTQAEVARVPEQKLTRQWKIDPVALQTETEFVGGGCYHVQSKIRTATEVVADMYTKY